MPKPTKGARLGGSPTHERMILRNLTSQLIEHGPASQVFDHPRDPDTAAYFAGTRG